jgi:hypothetical protein
MTLPRRDLERGLLRAERVIALGERCRPAGLAEEWQRVRDAWQRGLEAAPSWVRPASMGLGELRAALERVGEHAEADCGWGRLYAARARELAAEADLAEHVGAPDFHLRAAKRYPVDPGPDGERARCWAESWAVESARPRAGELVDSGDEGHPESLVSVMRSVVGAHRLPFRVVVHAHLLSAAATGDGIIVVRSGVMLRRFEVDRIVLHEVKGHALPRARAQGERSGLFRLGTAGGSDDEEGRALLLERRAGALSVERREELGRRHLAALGVRDGASFVETTRSLLSLGASAEQAVAIALRVHRGGGLARELVYLTALARLERGFEADPSAERWLERGRVSLSAVVALRELGEPPDRVFGRAA